MAAFILSLLFLVGLIGRAKIVARRYATEREVSRRLGLES